MNMDFWVQVAQVLMLSIVITQNIGLREQIKRLQDRLGRGT